MRRSPSSLAKGGKRPVPHRISVAVDRRYRRRVDASLLRDTAVGTLCSRRLRLARAVAITVTDTESVRRLNRDYLGLDEPTDVLAFETRFEGVRGPDGIEELGAVVIALPVAARGARARGVTLEDELALLIVHGTLHLLGVDHATRRDDAAMREMERVALERVGRPGAVR